MNSEEIRNARLSLGLTQKQFGEACGVGWRSVAHWEAGTRRVPQSAVRHVETLQSYGIEGIID